MGGIFFKKQNTYSVYSGKLYFKCVNRIFVLNETVGNLDKKKVAKFSWNHRKYFQM